MLLELSGPESPSPSNPSLYDLTTAYLDYVQNATRSYTTVIGHVRHIHRLLGKKTPCRSIKRADVIRYMQKRRNEKNKTGGFIAPATVDRELTTIKAVYNHACKEGTLDPPWNPAQYVKPANIPNARDSVVSDDEFMILLESLSAFHRPIWMFARFTGLRLHHILELDYCQFQEGILRPHDFDSRNHLYTSSKRFGAPPYDSSLLLLLDDPLPEKGPVFVYDKKAKKPKRMKHLQTVFELSRKRAGFHYLFHDLRRTFATDLRHKNVPIEVRTAIMGHAPDPRFASHMRYQVISREDILEVGQQVFADPFYKRCLKYCLANANEKERKYQLPDS